jgi:uncharacterized protein YbjT (DUF2867 family)
MINVLITGVTGSLGKNLVENALNNRQIKLVRALMFRNTKKIKSVYVDKILAGLNDTQTITDACKDIDTLFICLGSNYSNEKLTDFEEDFTLPLNIATIAKQSGVKQVVMVNTPFANARSNNQYLQNRGKLQQAVIDLQFQSTIIVQASSIRNVKKADIFFRFIGSNILNLLTFGKWHLHRPVNVNKVAKAMITLAIKNQQGLHIYSPHQIRNL